MIKNPKNIAETLVANPVVIGLVKCVSPLDLISSLAMNLDLCPEDALGTAIELIKHVGSDENEFYSEAAIEMGLNYPVLARKRVLTKVNNPENPLSSEENPEDVPELSEDPASGYTSGLHGPDWNDKKHQFPPEPRPNPQQWPYDDFTVAGMKYGKGIHRGNRRGHGGASNQ